MINEKLIVAGFGGQGVLMIGRMAALAGLENNYEVSWLPSYTSEMRGGTANCNVCVSEKPIDSPMILHPNTLIPLNRPSLLRFEPMLVTGGTMIMNSSMIEDEPKRTDIKVYKIPFNDLANKLGNERGMNMLVIGAYAAITKNVSLQNIYDAIDHFFTGDKEKYVKGNKEMAKAGYDYAVTTFNV